MKPTTGTLLAPLIVLGLVIALVYLHRNDPSQRGSAFPRCAFHSVTGLHCPGCGATRATHELTHGNLASAFGYNALIFVILPLFAYGVVTGTLRWCGVSPRFSSLFRARGFWIVLALSIIAFAVLRNLPVKPLSDLAP